MADFLNAVITDGPNKGLTIGECISLGHINPEDKARLFAKAKERGSVEVRK